MVYVALLRGINVGGRTMIKMSVLKDCFVMNGFDNVVTYINSGNVIFVTNKRQSLELERIIEELISEHFNVNIKVIVRSLVEYEGVINNIPVAWNVSKDLKCNVIFLKHDIDSDKILDNLPIKPEFESLSYYNGVLFWSAKTSDLTKSEMIKLSKNDLYQKMTVRNINSVNKIFDIMRSLER